MPETDLLQRRERAVGFVLALYVAEAQQDVSPSAGVERVIDSMLDLAIHMYGAGELEWALDQVAVVASRLTRSG